MFFFRPSWLQHGAEGSGSQPVFSVDIQAVGGRLASAGQDCKIRIWSCEDLVKAGSLKAASKSSESLPSRTQVLVVCWSSNTRFVHRFLSTRQCTLLAFRDWASS
uniref:Uncharacterized protein n=1 Tax=Rhodosorus marinus TaxID=101924 RepID=A0A7S2ZVC5_9RHOD